MNHSEWVNLIDFWINLLSNALTIVASAIAILIFFVNRKKISSVLNAILNYSTQLSLTELKFKIIKAQDLNANNLTEKEEVLNIFHDIIGQISGNRKINSLLTDISTKINALINDPKLLNEGTKRSVLSELAENLRNVDISTLTL